MGRTRSRIVIKHRLIGILLFAVGAFIIFMLGLIIPISSGKVYAGLSCGGDENAINTIHYSLIGRMGDGNLSDYRDNRGFVNPALACSRITHARYVNKLYLW